MGKTYKEQIARFDETRKHTKQNSHSNNRKFGGMKVTSIIIDEYGYDFFQDKVNISDSFDINKVSDEEL